MVVIMAVLLVMALRAREEAERRRVTADATIRKLLTEYAASLEGTGNVKLMVAVNQLAIDYYGGRAPCNSFPRAAGRSGRSCSMR